VKKQAIIAGPGLPNKIFFKPEAFLVNYTSRNVPVVFKWFVYGF